MFRKPTRAPRSIKKTTCGFPPGTLLPLWLPRYHCYARQLCSSVTSWHQRNAPSSQVRSTLLEGYVQNRTGAGNGPSTQFVNVNSSIIVEFGGEIAETVQLNIGLFSGDDEYLGLSLKAHRGSTAMSTSPVPLLCVTILTGQRSPPLETIRPRRNTSEVVSAI